MKYVFVCLFFCISRTPVHPYKISVSCIRFPYVCFYSTCRFEKYFFPEVDSVSKYPIIYYLYKRWLKDNKKEKKID